MGGLPLSCWRESYACASKLKKELPTAFYVYLTSSTYIYLFETVWFMHVSLLSTMVNESQGEASWSNIILCSELADIR